MTTHVTFVHVAESVGSVKSWGVVFWVRPAADVVANGVSMRLWRPGSPEEQYSSGGAGIAATLEEQPSRSACSLRFLAPTRRRARECPPLMAVGAASLYVAIRGQKPAWSASGWALVGTGLALG